MVAFLGKRGSSDTGNRITGGSGAPCYASSTWSHVVISFRRAPRFHLSSEVDSTFQLLTPRISVGN